MRLRLRVKFFMRLRRLRLLTFCIARQHFQNELKFKHIQYSIETILFIWFCTIYITENMNRMGTVIFCFIFQFLTMFNTIVRVAGVVRVAGAVGAAAGVASRYSSGYDQMMRLLVAADPQHWFDGARAAMWCGSGSNGSASKPDYPKYHKLGTMVGAGAASKFLPGAGVALKSVLRSRATFVRLQLRLQLVKNSGSGSSSDHFPRINKTNSTIFMDSKYFLFFKDINDHQKVNSNEIVIFSVNF
jgi:hypothetical protein